MFGWKWGSPPSSPARGNVSSGQPGSKGNSREPHYGRRSSTPATSRNADSDTEDLAKWMEKGYGTQPDGSLAKTSESTPREGTVNRNRSGDKLGNSTNLHGVNARDPRTHPSNDQFKGPQQAELDRGGFKRCTTHWKKLSVVAVAATLVAVYYLVQEIPGANRLQVSQWRDSGSSEPTSNETAVVIPPDYLPSGVVVPAVSVTSTSNGTQSSSSSSSAPNPELKVSPLSIPTGSSSNQATQPEAAAAPSAAGSLEWSADDLLRPMISKEQPSNTAEDDPNSEPLSVASNVQPKTEGSTPRIIGSKLKPGAQVAAFRDRWNCLTNPNTSEWSYDPTPRILPWPKEPLWRCDSKAGWLGIKSNALVRAGEYKRGNWPVAESLKYVWMPRTREECGAHSPPSFRVFNATEFCDTLRRTTGNLFIAGDSISSHFFISLINQMETYGAYVQHLKPTKSCQALINSLNMSSADAARAQHRKRLPCETYLVCGSSLSRGGKLISFSESMFLRRVHQDSEEQHSLFPRLDDLPELAWGEEMKWQRVSIAVLNRGAHFIRGQLGVDQLNHTLQQVRKLMPNALIVFRSTAAGHPNCTNYTSPVKEPFKADKWPFYWDRFAQQNDVTRKMVESIGGVFLDVNPLSTLRPDWHIGGKDCLHYCLPGLTDDWVKIFAKMLHDLT